MTDQVKDEFGRGLICLHDKTTDGGEVIAACDDIKAMGLPVAVKGNLAIERVASGTERMITMPFTPLFMVLRAPSLLICRQPVWPDSLNEINRADSHDPYAEPSGQKPVGWAPTIRAQQRGEYSESPRGDVPKGNGSKNRVENAEKWVMDKPPKGLAGT